jgi:hypothetical protein
MNWHRKRHAVFSECISSRVVERHRSQELPGPWMNH